MFRPRSTFRSFLDDPIEPRAERPVARIELVRLTAIAIRSREDRLPDAGKTALAAIGSLGALMLVAALAPCEGICPVSLRN